MCRLDSHSTAGRETSVLSFYLVDPLQGIRLGGQCHAPPTESPHRQSFKLHFFTQYQHAHMMPVGPYGVSGPIIS